jgi:molybdate transport system substrate-binding protein
MRVISFGLAARWLLLAAAVPASADGAGDPGAVAVAAGLYPCVSDLAERFAASGAAPPRLVVGSSGRLARQIEAGAPFGLFLSANLEWVEYLGQRNLVGPIVPLPQSPLVLWWPRREPPDLQLLSGAPRVAIADPAAAPFGRAARDYLEARGWYEELTRRKRLIVTGTVLQAALAAQSGGADMALTALSAAGRLGGSFTPVPVAPLQHAGALVRGRDTAAIRAFWEYLRAAEAEPIWRAWGFTPGPQAGVDAGTGAGVNAEGGEP